MKAPVNIEAEAPNRIADAFERCQAKGERALVTYIMGGDPNRATSQAMALACVDGGADLLEIGMPFSDPIADGPTIQRAAERALAAGTTVADCLQLVKSVRKRSEIPIALMGYLNPILAYGEQRFLGDCQQAGVDALILPDLPPEEAEIFSIMANQHGVRMVFLLAPTSTDARCAAACKAASAFVYFVSVTGVTGARAALPKDVNAQLERVRRHSQARRLPLVVGFGISTPEQARTVGKNADGVVVGSAIVSRIAQGGSTAARVKRVRGFVASLKRGLR